MEWKPPPHAQSFQECTVKYKLEYHSTGDRDWKVRHSMNESSQARAGVLPLLPAQINVCVLSRSGTKAVPVFHEKPDWFSGLNGNVL